MKVNNTKPKESKAKTNWWFSVGGNAVAAPKGSKDPPFPSKMLVLLLLTLDGLRKLSRLKLASGESNPGLLCMRQVCESFFSNES